LNTLAVLPFKSLQPNSSDEHLGIGFADTLITKLGGLRQLIVRPTSAVRKYNSPEQDPLAAGREQQVEAVLDASLQRNGERIRVNVRLLKVGDGATLWSYQCDEEYCADIFVMQDTISEKVAAALTTELTGEERKRLQKHYTENRAAYDLYLKGRFFWEKRTAEALQKAIEHYQQALALDPNFALPYVGLARYDHVGAMLPPRERAPRLKAFARKALALDETLGEAHTALAWLLFQYDWNWAEAEREFRRGLELDPNSALAHKIYGYYLAAMERHEEGIAELKRAQQLDPLSLGNNMELGTQFFFAKRIAEAVAQFQKTQELEPNSPDIYKRLGMGYAHLDRYEEAVAALEKGLAMEPENDQALGILGYTYAKWGKREAALRQRDKLKDLARQRYISDFWPGLIYSGLREKEQAFAHLQRACQERFWYMVFLKVDPKFDNLRSDPRFADLLRCVGLPQ
jgi:TolB-like protein/Tfp pilus assembly protein PilF